MLKKTLITLTLPLLSLLAISAGSHRVGPTQPRQGGANAPTDTLQKMIVESGSVTMDLDLNGFNGSGSLVARPVTLQFAVGPNSFFPILMFNDLLRGAGPGSMTLIPQNASSAGINAPGYSNLPALLGASLKQLVVEKLPSDQGFDLAVRDSNTGFTFFNVEGHQYDYDPNARALSITNGRLLVSKEFANALGRPSDAGSVVGKISVGAAMQLIEITRLGANGDVKSESLPAVGTVPGPDVIVGDLLDFVQMENGAVNGFVGLALGTDACNKGTVDVEWIALPDNRHPFIPQNLYRMSSGATNNERFEQIGQSWGKHAFAAASADDCGFGCNGVGGDHLGSGCSDAYGAGLNGSQDLIGSRAWVNPFTGFFAQSPDPNNHSNHVGIHAHDVTSHRILVNVSDLSTAQNPGATYFAEAEYIVPHEGTWCQAHPDQCNMYNNASYKQYTVTGVNQPFTFNPVGQTHREQPAITAWTGATVSTPIQPAPGTDGIWFMGYKVTGPNAGVWHYEYALYNQNLDRAIQSFSVPLGAAVNITNIEFHAPPQHPGFPQDGTQGDAGYSSTPWNVTQDASSITWSTETFATNQNANAIRFGTLYNFRFDADQAPNPTAATVGFFKTGSPMGVIVQAPGAVPTPSPTPTPTPTATATPTPTGTPSATPTATATPSATATPTATPTPTASPCGGFISSGAGGIVPGDTDTGNHCDDCDTAITLPFPVMFLGQTFTSVNVSSNGRLDFVCVNEPGGFVTQCLPASPNQCSYDNTIFPLWQDMRTDMGLSGCANFPGGTCGVFTSVSGSAPNRIFNIEWRTVLFANNDATQNFEVQFYENDPTGRFDVVYGAIDSTGADHNYVAGLQGPDGCFLQDFCANPAPVQNVVHTYGGQGGTPTPTPTVTPPPSPTPTPSEPPPTPSPTPTVTPTATATPSATPRATPRARPTPRPRPTP